MIIIKLNSRPIHDVKKILIKLMNFVEFSFQKNFPG